MTATDTSRLADAVFDAAAGRDVAAARTVVQDWLAGGRPVAPVLAALAEAQIRVGERWYSDEWSVADEHAATAIVDAALAVVEGVVGRREPDHPRSSVVVACPEGEWHALPGRMLATELRTLGADVVFLGSSMPADHLARYVDHHRPDLVALSVSTAFSFSAAATAIDAIRRVGVPIVVGGRAFGGSDRRARSLGADGWSAGGSGIVPAALFGAEEAMEAAARRQDREAEVLRLELDRPEVVERAMGVLVRRQLAHTRQDLDGIIRFAEAAILVEDPLLFVEFVGWLGPLLAVRGVPAGAVSASLDTLIEVSTDDGLCAVLQTGVEAARQS